MRARSLAHSALSFLVLSPLALAASSSNAAAHKSKKLAAENNPDDPTGKTLYITEPACGYYRCVVTWPAGSHVAVNWLGPPAGDVSVSLVSNVGGPTYTIVSSMPGTSQEGYCDSGYGLGVVAPGHECGRVEFVVPDGWKQMDNYTIAVQSLSDSSLAGYTDAITVAPYDASSSLAVPSGDVPSGTKASLVAVAAPTSTNEGASTKYTGKVPSPTAGAGAASSSAPWSSAAPASSSVLSTSVRMTSALSVDASAMASAAGQTTLSSAPFSFASASPRASSSTSSVAPSSAGQTGAGPAGPLVARTLGALCATALGFALLA